jgi:hypothetical protein
MLEIGMYGVNITPYIGCALGGFGARKEGAQGIHDDIFAKIVFIQGAESVVIVSLDLVGISVDMVGKIRFMVTEITKVPKNNIMISATHNHAGPDIILWDQDRVSKAYKQSLIENIVGGITAAWRFRGPSRIGFSQGRIDGIGVNQRHHDGKPIDPGVAVIRVDDQNGNLKGVLINYTCHPTILGSNNLFVTAGYPGYATRLIERIKGENVIAMFTNGAAADINAGHSPDLSAIGYPIPERTFKRAEKLGNMLAGEVLKTLEVIETMEEVPVAAKTRIVSLPLKKMPSFKQIENDLKEKECFLKDLIKSGASDKEIAKAEIQKLYAYRLLKLKKERQENLQNEYMDVELQVIRIGECALLACPAEVFVEIGLKIKEKSPFKQTVFVGYANGYVGHIPTSEAIKEGGFEVVTSRFNTEAENLIENAAAGLLKSVY